jgi:N-ethylmaleimide reductase
MDLFSPFQLGPLALKNRVALAPMTRSRALDGGVPNPLAARYYAQRASAGLLISEGSQVSPQGVGYVRTPGIHSAAQVEGWKPITEAVHQAGGVIFLQLWHVGRLSHPDFHGGALPVAPSAIAASGAEVWTPNGKSAAPTPRALETAELPGIVEQFRLAAENAKAAGFDGVEIHGANGYLLDQFLRDGSNQRSDAYGGSIENRARLPLEVADAVISVWGPERVGYRVAPSFARWGMADSSPVETFSYLARELSARRIGYLHVAEGVQGISTPADPSQRIAPILRQVFQGVLIEAGGYDRASGDAAIDAGEADLVAFGVPFLANPDLVERLRAGAPLNAPQFESFYATPSGDDAAGYTDYPVLAVR